LITNNGTQCCHPPKKIGEGPGPASRYHEADHYVASKHREEHEEIGDEADATTDVREGTEKEDAENNKTKSDHGAECRPVMAHPGTEIVTEINGVIRRYAC
jgi:hypothetical protein